jgi:hypothetical protein
MFLAIFEFNLNKFEYNLNKFDYGFNLALTFLAFFKLMLNLSLTYALLLFNLLVLSSLLIPWVD